MTTLDSPRTLDLVAQLRQRITELEQRCEVEQTRAREEAPCAVGGIS